MSAVMSMQETNRCFYPENSVHAFYELKSLKEGLEGDVVELYSLA